MTRIESVTTTSSSVPLHTPFVTALRRTTTTETVVVTVRDSDGRVGWGEAPQVWQVTGESLAGATACIESMLAPLLVGESIGPDSLVGLSGRIAGVVARNFGAKAAVDTAVHDLVAQQEGLGLGALLAGRADGIPLEIPTDVTISAGDPASLAEAARERGLRLHDAEAEGRHGCGHRCREGGGRPGRRRCGRADPARRQPGLDP